jgi:hypothetical protein
MIYPRGGTYTPSESKFGEPIILDLNETPSSGFHKRIIAVADFIVQITGYVFLASGAVNFFKPSLFNEAVESVKKIGSFILFGYNFKK